MTNRFEPRILELFREGYSTKQFVSDFFAGVVVGIVALPLAIAFGIAAGLGPEQGLYASIVAGFLIAFFSGSRVQIGGPSGTFVALMFHLVEKYGFEGLAIATILAGFILIVMGISQLGSVIRYIPYPVIVGFTAGIALIIFSGQIRDFLGLEIEKDLLVVPWETRFEEEFKQGKLPKILREGIDQKLAEKKHKTLSDAPIQVILEKKEGHWKIIKPTEIFFKKTNESPPQLVIYTDRAPSEFIEKCVEYPKHIHTLNPYALGIGLFTIMIILFWPKITKLIPGSIIALLVTSMVVQIFEFPVDTIASRFGNVPNTLPSPSFPSVNFHLIKELFPPAFSLALLIGIESLLSAVVSDGMTEQQHHSNMELVAEGIANIFSPIFLGIPAAGVLARTVTNVKNGGRTPISGIVHSVTLLMIMLVFGKWAVLIPMPTLAGILIMVSYNMGDWKLFSKMARSGPRSDFMVLITTFLLIILVDLIVGIEIGIVLAALLFMKRMGDITSVNPLEEAASLKYEESSEDPLSIKKREIPKGVEVYEIYGPFFFGAADKFKNAIRQIHYKPTVLILRLRHVPMMDATGLRALEEVVLQTKKEKTTLILSGIHEQPLRVLKDSEVYHLIGEENIFTHIDAALKRAKEIVDALPPQGSSTKKIQLKQENPPS